MEYELGGGVENSYISEVFLGFNNRIEVIEGFHSKTPLYTPTLCPRISNSSSWRFILQEPLLIRCNGLALMNNVITCIIIECIINVGLSPTNLHLGLPRRRIGINIDTYVDAYRPTD